MATRDYDPTEPEPPGRLISGGGGRGVAPPHHFLGVQTAQEATKDIAPWWESWPMPFAILAAGSKVRVVTPESDRHGELLAGGYAVGARTQYYLRSRDRWEISATEGALDLVEGRACKCGCGLPCPVGQAYADTDFCRKREYVYFRPQIDLRGMDRSGAERATQRRPAAVAPSSPFSPCPPGQFCLHG